MSILKFPDFSADLAWLVGGSSSSHSATQYSYFSAAGYSVVLTGTGLTYDAGGTLTGGTITKVQMTTGANLLLDWTGLTIAATDYAHNAFEIADSIALETAMLAGNDAIYGGPGNGQLHGHAGNDTLHGGLGDDWLYGGLGRDRYFGDDGTDGVTFAWDDVGSHGVRVDLRLATGQVRDDGYGNVETATSIERWEGSSFNDSIIGSDAYETLWGQAGNDVLRGGGNSDWLFGNAGDDSLYGDDGVDILNGGQGTDYYDGGADGDILALWVDEGTTTGATIDLRLGAGNIVNDGFGNTETAINVENIEGTALGDLFHARNVAAGGPDVLRGMAGNDTLIGGAASSVLNGNDGDDSLRGGTADETLAGGAGQDRYDGGAGVDMLDLWLDGFNGHGATLDLRAAVQISDDGYGNAEIAQRIENLSLSDFADHATGSNGANLIWGNAGNDLLNGMGSDDMIHGGAGDDTILGGTGSDQLTGDAGNDRLTGGTGADMFLFTTDLASTGVDTLADMASGVDMIYLSAQWGGGLNGSPLVAVQFLGGAGLVAATTANQRVIYNSTKGDLYFDADGNGTSAAAILFAHVAPNTVLTFHDFSGIA